jgi:Mg-chelatase subunit ChlD
MTWAMKRQIIYFSIFMAIMLVVIGIPLFSIYYEAPTCFDNKQNGNELGVDCDGLCNRLCRALEAKPVVEWYRLLDVQPGLSTAVAYLQNPNLDAEAKVAPYTFTIRDASNTIIAERKGTTYIPAGKNFAIFESNIVIPADAGQLRTTFELSEDFEWTRAPKDAPKVLVANQQVDAFSMKPSVTATLTNTSFTDLGRVNATVIIYNTDGNAVAASKTYVDRINKQGNAQVVFTWPRQFSSEVASCQQPTDVILGIDRSGSMAVDNKNPPEPLTSVKNAAILFVDALRSHDKVGLVSFATTGSDPIDQILTSDHAIAKSAIDEIYIHNDGTQYTNIFDAIELAKEELLSSRHQAKAKRAIVLLTDGNPTYPEKKGDPNYPADRALASARDAQSQEIEIYTIGLGKDLDENFLKAVAGSDNRYFKAPTTKELTEIYKDIGASLCKLGPAKVEIIPEVLPR